MWIFPCTFHSVRSQTSSFYWECNVLGKCVASLSLYLRAIELVLFFAIFAHENDRILFMMIFLYTTGHTSMWSNFEPSCRHKHKQKRHGKISLVFAIGKKKLLRYSFRFYVNTWNVLSLANKMPNILHSIRANSIHSMYPDDISFTSHRYVFLYGVTLL